jgi:hypothetical protein
MKAGTFSLTVGLRFAPGRNRKENRASSIESKVKVGISGPLCFFAAIVLLWFPGTAQHRNHAIGIDLGSPGWLYSITYEYQTTRKVIARTGVGYFPYLYSGYVGAGKLFGKSKSNFELMTGLTGFKALAANSFEREDTRGFIFLHLGYRYQQLRGRMIYRIGLHPLFQIYSDDGPVIPFSAGAGLGLAYRF